MPTEITLSSIVKSYMIRKGLDTKHRYMRYLHLAIEGLEELNMDVSGTPTFTYLTIDHRTLTSPLPNDYITYRRIGVCVGDKLVPMGYNPNICLVQHFDDCGNEIRPEQSVPRNGMFGFFGGNLTQVPLAALSQHYNQNGEQTGGYYGIGGGQRPFGEYVIDTPNNRIQFSSMLRRYCSNLLGETVPNPLFSNRVVLEYLASPMKSKGKYVVHPHVKPSLIAWIDWADVQTLNSVSPSIKEQKRREYYNQRRLTSERINAFTLDEAYQFLRKANKESPKF